jgi:uncharacterized protein
VRTATRTARSDRAKELLKVPRLGPKAFEQAPASCASRRREPARRSAVHPEAYPVVERILKKTGSGRDEER